MGSAERKSSELDARKLALYEMAYNLALATLRGYRWRADDPAAIRRSQKSPGQEHRRKHRLRRDGPQSNRKMGPGERFSGEATSVKAFSQSSPAPRRDECGESGRKQARPALHRGRDRRHRPAVAHEAERVATTVLRTRRRAPVLQRLAALKAEIVARTAYYCGCTGAVAGGGVAVGALGVEPGSKYQTMISARTSPCS